MSTYLDSKIGLPLSRVSSSASSSMFFSTRSASRHSSRPRSLVDILRHGPPRSSNAWRAALTARSTSSGEASTIWVKTSPVAGLMVLNFLEPSTHSPLISRRPGETRALVAAIIVEYCCGASLRLDGRGAPVPTRALFGFKLCRALLDVSSQAFLCIFTLEKQLLVLALEGQRSFQRNLPAGLHAALDATYRFRRFVRRAELARVFHDVFHEAVTLVNVIDDSELERLFKGIRVAGDHQLDRFALPYKARKPLSATRSWQNAEIHFRQTNLARIFACDANIGGHGDLQPTADGMPVERRNHQLGRVLQAKQHFVGVEAEVILEGRIDAGKHLNIRTSGKKLISRPGQQDDIHIIIHPSFENGVVELPVHFIGVRIRRRIVHLDHPDAFIGAVIDELFRSLAGCGLHCCRHIRTPLPDLRFLSLS